MVGRRPAPARESRDASRGHGAVFHPDRDLPPSSLRMDESKGGDRPGSRQQTRLLELALLPLPFHFLFLLFHCRDAALPPVLDPAGPGRQSSVYLEDAPARFRRAAALRPLAHL